MTNDKAKMSNQAQNPKDEKISLSFCHLDFAIWIFVNGF